MKKRNIELLLWTGLPFLLIIFITTAAIKNSVRNKLETMLTENNSGYITTAQNIHISILSRGITIEGIKIVSARDSVGLPGINGKIASLEIKGVKLVNAIFKKKIDIRKIIVSDSYIKGTVPSSSKTRKPVILPLNISIDNIIIKKLNLSVETDSSAASYLIKDGNLTLYEIQSEKYDTLTTGILNSFDFSAKELILVSADSVKSVFDYL